MKWAQVFTAALPLIRPCASLLPQRTAGLLSPTPSLSDIPNGASLNIERLWDAIYTGRVYQQKSFLTEEQVQVVLEEIAQFESAKRFERKGLSNTLIMKNQTFSYQDRSICVVPWFLRALDGQDTREIPTKIRDLQHTLSAALKRPTIMDTSLSHECYYSKSEIGSSLSRHMDERHEETKGAKGWLRPSRRSLSWLIYLSDPDWDLSTHGGALRSFPQPRVLKADSTHEGNLQVGWILPEGKEDISRPVYMDSWFSVMGIVAEGTVPEPHCLLYTVVERSGERVAITRPWLTDAVQGMAVADFIKAWAHQSAQPKTRADEPTLFLDSNVASRFALLEDRPEWDAGNDPRGSEVIDIAPLRGSLVVFDSVVLPHQVERIEKGTRVALAGWFHEETQQFPEGWFVDSL